MRGVGAFIIAFGCSFFLNREGSNGDYVKSVLLFLGGMLAGVLISGHQ